MISIARLILSLDLSMKLNFDFDNNFDILSVSYPQSNSGSGLCRVYGSDSNNWEQIGGDLIGGSQDERFGKRKV